MSLRFLLDTNVVSEPLRPEPNSGVLSKLREHQASIAIAAVVWHELVYGSARLPASSRRTAIERYLQQVVAVTIPVLAYDERAATWHGAERARLARLGLTPAFADGQLAAVARTNQLVLVTANVADFAAFEGLAVEDWRG